MVVSDAKEPLKQDAGRPTDARSVFYVASSEQRNLSGQSAGPQGRRPACRRLCTSLQASRTGNTARVVRTMPSSSELELTCGVSCGDGATPLVLANTDATRPAEQAETVISPRPSTR